ncbi:general stress protein CsbD [Mariniphaga sediminis]|jgi:predicted nuclease of restriction endonuclease-like RecB superfamily|uniref:General stress protein CsbD n=1 Tax=Mariniphaga sediminis TaxID=1628158 RepID=A0A399CUU7_9BACT|nr:general stress protein CsbD [Mariniphaga sediminis]RIH63409.1 general stress protein CsbD [Mariniphaga sediminis]
METKFDMNEWGRIKEKLKNKYPELTDADMYWGRVSGEDLIQMISSKLGKTKKELMDEIGSLEYTS